MKTGKSLLLNNVMSVMMGVTMASLSILIPLKQAHADEIVFPGVSWETRTAAQVGLDDAKLEQIKGILGGHGVIIRNGYMVKSWGDFDVNKGWWSSVKPIFATEVFFAIQEGKITSVDELVNPHVFEYTGQNLISKDSNMTWRHLGAMISGYARGDPAGDAWSYNDVAINLYQKLLRYVIFQGEGDHNSIGLNPNRLGPLQMQEGSLFQASVRDWARLCWFWLNKGNWNGTQLLDQQFFDDFMMVQAPGSLPTTTTAGTDYLGTGTFGAESFQSQYKGQGLYGFNWWFNGIYGPNGKRAWPDGPLDTIMTLGAGGASSVMIPSLNIVIVGNSSAWGPLHPGLTGENQNIVLKLITEAVGVVDGLDFLKWQRGETQNPLSASDLSDWQSNYGTVTSLAATSTAVPEPATGIMLLIGMATLLTGGRTLVSKLIR